MLVQRVKCSLELESVTESGLVFLFKHFKTDKILRSILASNVVQSGGNGFDKSKSGGNDLIKVNQVEMELIKVNQVEMEFVKVNQVEMYLLYLF